MEKLKKMALTAIFDCIFQWQLEDNSEDQMKTSVQLIKYFEKLPCSIRDEILNCFMLTGFWGSGYFCMPRVQYVALFLNEEQKQLKMNFYILGEDFTFEFLLKVCGHKLKNLTELQLPNLEWSTQGPLAVSVWKEIYQIMPNLQKLNLAGSFIEDGAAIYRQIAKLSLIELDPGTNMSDGGVRELCGENSKAKHTLRVLKLGEAAISNDYYCLILKTMNLMEDMDCYSTQWLSEMPLDLQQRQYNMRKLRFFYALGAIEDELDLAVVTCPKVSEIKMTVTIVTPKMLCNLAKFKELSSLDVRVSPKSDVNRDEENQLFDRQCLDNLYFRSLVEFSLYDCKNGWISCGYFFDLLDMCPVLEKLELSHCDGFSNKTASELAAVMANAKLKRLKIHNCPLMGPSGIDDLLKITSLVELEVTVFCTEERKQFFDAHPMQQTAEENGVYLQLIVYSTDRDN